MTDCTKYTILILSVVMLQTAVVHVAGSVCLSQGDCSGFDQGVCINVTAGCCGGQVQSGVCPGNSDIQCCSQNPCNAPTGQGTCLRTQECTGFGDSPIPGYCFGGSNTQCCVDSSLPPTGTFALDISAELSSLDTAQCMVKSGFSRIVVRSFRSVGSIDSNACTSMTTAVQAGFSAADGYLFPCTSCGDPAGQVTDTVQYLRSNCTDAWSGFLWLDIEGYGTYWGGNATVNQDFFEGLVTGCDKNGIPCGVYCSQDEWLSIMGPDYTGAADSGLPLWWVLWSGGGTYFGFVPYGGWDQPAFKQYNGDQVVCGFDVDYDW
eukprot:CAMPEP_0119127324 /NCGR_PEP_ID=MMETSP1310-20130426/5923_1 /TAXON_ID=464262 /ORGANISM="Genus nov. species nov., Strain RCC2339" /LENGTH=318 /DNA_ID=CAMNT_0007117575 /DNA_START=84 /DNA_END=1037 /DNA_ORIENTATION=+